MIPVFPHVDSEACSVLQIRGCKPILQQGALLLLETIISNSAPADLDLPLLPKIPACSSASLGATPTKFAANHKAKAKSSVGARMWTCRASKTFWVSWVGCQGGFLLGLEYRVSVPMGGGRSLVCSRPRRGSFKQDRKPFFSAFRLLRFAGICYCDCQE